MRIKGRFFQMIRNYKEGKGEGVELQVEKIPKLRERWNVMYEWIIVLMGYIEKMLGWNVKAMRTDRMKIVIQEAAGLGDGKGPKDLKITNQGSGED